MCNVENMAAFQEWLEQKYDVGQAQTIMDELSKCQDQCDDPQYFSLKLMGDLINDYRKDILQQRQEFKKLREKESSYALANLHIRQRMNEMDKAIRQSVANWTDLREDYFVQRVCFLGQCAPVWQREKSRSVVSCTERLKQEAA